jgi:Arylsulfotransferase (ASST)
MLRGSMFSTRAPIACLIALGLAAGVLTAPTPQSASSAQSAPTCTPATLDGSALQAGSVTVSPLAGSRDASSQTQISFLGVPIGELSHVSVVGSRSGTHSGRLLAYSKGNGASFLPSRPFTEGERVSVHAQLRTSTGVHPLVDQFAIAEQDSISSTPETTHPGGAKEVQGYRSRPTLRPPIVSVTADSPSVAPGDEFLAPYSGPGQAGPMILDQSGGLVWFKPLPTDKFATNFRVQEYLKKPVLTWWQGDISIHGYGLGEGVIFDQSYLQTAHVRAANGVQADLHDFQLTPQGTALITAYDPILCNVSSVGGPSYGAVTDGLLQEIDVKTGLVMFQWTSLDHVSLSESYAASSKTTASPFDFFHINSINLDRDGSLLISARNTWAVYDLDGRSGQILWRLGGKHSSFTMGPGTSTAWQHDPRELANGSISIFDNGSSPKVHSQSRGIVVGLDPGHKTATLQSQLVHLPALRADSQGNMQALENGDWFLGFGQDRDFSELSPSGQLLFDAHFPTYTQSYRSFRFTWTGTPVHPPAFVYEPGSAGTGTVYVSWNGATQVATWKVLTGATSKSLTPIANAPRSGFETAIALPAPAGPYMTVQALDATGAVIATAPTSIITAAPGQ